MLKSTELEIELNELRTKMAGIPELRSDDAEFQTRMGERGALNTQLVGLLEKQNKALRTEDQEAQAMMMRNVDTDGWPAELRAKRDLAQKTNIVTYLKAAADQSEIREGPEYEYGKEVLGNMGPGDYPLEMLLDRDEMVKLDANALGFETKDEEKRTLLTGVANNAGNISWADRLLADTDAAYLMAQFPAVGPGRHSYPIITGQTVADDYNRGATETPAGGLTVETVDAQRIQHAYQMSTVDDFHMPGIAAYLARDLRASLMSGLDKKVIIDLNSELTQVADTATITLAKWFAKWGAVVDGRAAKSVNDVKWLVGTHGRGTPPVSTYSFASCAQHRQRRPLLHPDSPRTVPRQHAHRTGRRDHHPAGRARGQDRSLRHSPPAGPCLAARNAATRHRTAAHWTATSSWSARCTQTSC